MLHVKKKPFAAAFISALLIPLAAGALLVNLAAANGYIEIPPLNMSITVQSPETKVYTENNVPVTFTVDGNFQGWSLFPDGFTCRLDGQASVRFSVSYTVSGSSYYCSTTLSGLPEGLHDSVITVRAEYVAAYGWASQLWFASSKPVSFTINAAAPHITVLSPRQGSYNTNSFPLNFSISESDISWVGYSLDGAATQTINGNTTLTGLSYGTHTIVVYATDTAGTTGASPSTSFNIETQQTEPSQLQGETEPQPSTPFPTTSVAAASVSVAVVGAGLLVYFAKSRKNPKHPIKTQSHIDTDITCTHSGPEPSFQTSA
jgi:hypothetical protein